MKWHQIRSHIATFALLPAVFSVGQLCAQQKPLDQAADLLSEGLDRRSGDYRRLVLRLWEC
jgi:hypothetical protein